MKIVSLSLNLKFSITYHNNEQARTNKTVRAFILPKIRDIKRYPQNRKEQINMKQGRTLEQLGQELQRQRTARADFIADTRQLNFKTDNNKSRITFESNNKTLVFGINQLAHQQIASRLGIPLKYYQRMQAEAPALLDENVNIKGLQQIAVNKIDEITDNW